MLQSTYRIFLKGLLALLPLVATFYLIIWLATLAEDLFGAVLISILPADIYVPGMGIVMGMLAIFAVGLMLEAWFMQALLRWGERLMDHMPGIRQIYRSLKQMLDYVTGTEHPRAGRVVLVRFDELRLIGLVTLEAVDFIPTDRDDEELVAVFIPFSYQIGGYTVYMPRSRLEHIDMEPQTALRLSLMAGVSGERTAGTKGKKEAGQPGKTATEK